MSGLVSGREGLRAARRCVIGGRINAEPVLQKIPEAGAAVPGAKGADFLKGLGPDKQHTSPTAPHGGQGSGQGSGQALAGGKQPAARQAMQKWTKITWGATPEGPITGAKISMDEELGPLRFVMSRMIPPPQSPLTQRAQKEAGTIQTWGGVRYAQRVQTIRAIDDKKNGKKIKGRPRPKKPSGSRLSAMTSISTKPMDARTRQCMQRKTLNI
ncbi:g2278 [Coccomyxa viridis]|uniref:G2278 protein n=1 Tax=Coccomyxa viridis TaxID=1274662 RepID=A0ABP1FK11_9CHLO